MNKTVVLISDYGAGDPSFTEVILKLRALLPDVYFIPHATPPFSTINTGFWINQIALESGIAHTYIYSNTAPRKENPHAQKENDGEKLMYVKLTNGFEIMAVNAGYVFSFVKPFIKEFYYVNVNNNGSQFRSRDNYPMVVAKMVKENISFLDKREEKSIIPDYPDNMIASIDGYGNIKTTIRKSKVSFKFGETVTITINNKTLSAIYSDGIFNAENSILVVAPGSSGYDDRFIEIVFLGGSAAKLFDNPIVETPFILQKTK